MGGDVRPPRSSRGPPPLPRPRSSRCCTGLPASTRAVCRSWRRTDVIGMDDHPVESVRAKPDSSLVAAVRGVAAGEVDAVVSAGSTGAMLAASLLHIRRLPGVRRPAIAVVIPARRGPTVLIDAGANADARPEDLVQFAHMGVVFAQRDPRGRGACRTAAVDRRGGREGQSADAGCERAPPRELPALRGEHREPEPARRRLRMSS